MAPRAYRRTLSRSHVNDGGRAALRRQADFSRAQPDSNRVARVCRRRRGARLPGVVPHDDALFIEKRLGSVADPGRCRRGGRFRLTGPRVFLHLDEDRSQRRIRRALLDVGRASLRRGQGTNRRGGRSLLPFRRGDDASARRVVGANLIVEVTMKRRGVVFRPDDVPHDDAVCFEQLLGCRARKRRRIGLRAETRTDRDQRSH